jgi:large subunit ribosomal protein L9
MQVILKKDVEKLGYKDEIVNVKNGYGRNYLVPHGLASVATPSIKKQHEETLRQRSHKVAKLVDEAKANLVKLQAVAIKVGAKVGENGKIFGSVTTVQLADAFTKLGLAVERKQISIDGEAIKTIGSYVATIKLGKDVAGKVTFEVVEE